MLTQKEIKRISLFVKKEPRTVQEIARHIGRSWVTTDSYVKKIAERTGTLNTKIFRQGTKGAVKIVYWNYAEAVEYDEIKKLLYEKIRLARTKYDFDPFEIYQYIPKKRKKATLEIYTDPTKSTKQNIISFLSKAENEIILFSGNNSWALIKENGISVLKVIEDLLRRGVNIKIICRVDLSSVDNLNKISRLINKYPEQIEIRHAYHPLRGFIIDAKKARLKDETKQENKNMRVFYEWYDPEWVYWLHQVFWNLFRNAPTAEERMKQLNEIF